MKTILWLFVAGLVLGAITSFTNPELMTEITKSFAEQFGENPALDYDLAQSIFIRNLTVSLMAWLGGILIGLAPVFIVFVNGLILGYVVGYILFTQPDILQNLVFLAVGLIPHGIFELPAFFLAAVLGMKLGFDWLAQSAKGARLVVLKNAFIYTSKAFLWVVGALIIAAFIEVFVSGQLVNNL